MLNVPEDTPTLKACIDTIQCQLEICFMPLYLQGALHYNYALFVTFSLYQVIVDDTVVCDKLKKWFG